MDRAEAIRSLPTLYARVLLLKDEGLDEQAIAIRLEIDTEAVGPALRVAEGKLTRLLAGETASNEKESSEKTAAPATTVNDLGKG